MNQLIVWIVASVLGIGVVGADLASEGSSAGIASAQQSTAADNGAGRTWSVTQTADKMTDRTMVTATATARAEGNAAHVYQLTVKCDGEPREFALSTWSTTGALVSRMTGRPMAWQTRVVQSGGQVTSRDSSTNAPRAYAPIVASEVADPIRFRYRIDNAPASSSILTRVSDNVAHILPTDVFIPPSPAIDSGGVLSSEQERVLARIAAASKGATFTPALPKARLLIADVFPGETVEFSFAALTPDQRSALQKMCQFDQPIETKQSVSTAAKPVAAPTPPPIRVSAVSTPVTKSVSPVYPESAIASRLEGVVAIDITIGRDGKVTDTTILRHGPIHSFDQAALDAVRQWEFVPVLVEGKAVPAILTVSVRISPDSNAANAASAEPRAPLRLDDPSSLRPTVTTPPVYPSAARAAHVEGAVVIDTTIGPDGKVKDMAILRHGPLEALDQSALDAVRQWQFAPTLVDGKPVPVIVALTVTFSLK